MAALSARFTSRTVITSTIHLKCLFASFSPIRLLIAVLIFMALLLKNFRTVLNRDFIHARLLKTSVYLRSSFLLTRLAKFVTKYMLYSTNSAERSQSRVTMTSAFADSSIMFLYSTINPAPKPSSAKKVVTRSISK